MSSLFRAIGSAVTATGELISGAADLAFNTVKKYVSAAGLLFSREPARLPPHVEELAVPGRAQKGGGNVANEGARKDISGILNELNRKLEKLAVRNEVARIVKEARLQMGVDCVKYYNFAVCGQSGVGKSSFINGFLGLMGNMASPVGEVETTQKIQSYSTKRTPHLMLWDIPGAGTINHPANTYFEDKKLFVFDAILILSSDRFLAVDFNILQSARKYHTPCVFVRTKCDISVHSRALRDGIDTFTASQRIRRDVKSSFDYSLAKAGLKSDTIPEPELFFISTNYFLEENPYDFYNKKTKCLDTSLSSMDELKLMNFLYDTAKIRAPIL